MLLLHISGARCRWWPRPPALPGARWQDGRYRPPPPTRSEGPSCRASSTGGAIEPLLVRAPPHPTTVGRVPKRNAEAWRKTRRLRDTTPGDNPTALLCGGFVGWVVFGRGGHARALAQAHLVSFVFEFPPLCLFWRGGGREREREERGERERERERESSQ